MIPNSPFLRIYSWESVSLIALLMNTGHPGAQIPALLALSGPSPAPRSQRAGPSPAPAGTPGIPSTR